MMWEIVFLVAVIVVLLVGIIVFWGRSAYRHRKLQREASALREELQRIHEINAALRKSLGVGSGSRLRQYSEIAEFARDLESLRCAIAGSKICEEMLFKKYGVGPGPELLRRILARPGIDFILKGRLADEMLVGEIGRSLLRSLDKGSTVERAAAEARVPLVVAKGQITRLQILGYLDSRLKLTERGRDALI
jgi:hypothetical protein